MYTEVFDRFNVKVCGLMGFQNVVIQTRLTEYVDIVFKSIKSASMGRRGTHSSGLYQGSS